VSDNRLLSKHYRKRNGEGWPPSPSKIACWLRGVMRTPALPLASKRG
jgi:hypothetical protein